MHLFTHVDYVRGMIAVFVWQYCQYGWELCGALVYPCKVVRVHCAGHFAWDGWSGGVAGPASFICQCLQVKTSTGQS